MKWKRQPLKAQGWAHKIKTYKLIIVITFTYFLNYVEFSVHEIWI